VQGLRECTRRLHDRHHKWQIKAGDFGTVAERIHILGAALQECVGNNATVHRQAGVTGEVDARPQADGGEHQIGFDDRAIDKCGDDTRRCARHRLHASAQRKAHAGGFECCAQKTCGQRWQQSPKQLRSEVDNIYIVTAEAQIIGKFTADEAGAKDDDSSLVVQRVAEPLVVGKVVHGQHAISGISGERQADRVRADRQHQLGVSDGLAVHGDVVRGRIDCRYRGMRAHRGRELTFHVRCGVEGDQRRGFFQCQGVRQNRLGIKTASIPADEVQWGRGIKFAEFTRRGIAREPGPDDHDGRHVCPWFCFVVRMIARMRQLATESPAGRA